MGGLDEAVSGRDVVGKMESWSWKGFICRWMLAKGPACVNEGLDDQDEAFGKTESSEAVNAEKLIKGEAVKRCMDALSEHERKEKERDERVKANGRREGRNGRSE